LNASSRRNRKTSKSAALAGQHSTQGRRPTGMRQMSILPTLEPKPDGFSGVWRTSGSSCARSLSAHRLRVLRWISRLWSSRFANRSKNNCRAETAPRSRPILLCCASRGEIAAAETRRHTIQRIAQTRPRPGITLLSAQPDLGAIATVPPRAARSPALMRSTTRP